MTAGPGDDVFCAHGRLSCEECKVRPKRPSQKRAEIMGELAGFMVANRLLVMEWEDETMRIRFERDPAPVVASSASMTAPPAEASRQCACGHSLVTEHSAAGCYHGCRTDECNRTVKDA